MALVAPGCLPKRDTATTPTTDTDRIAALESKVSQLQSKIASLPESGSGDYDEDIIALQEDIANVYDELYGVLDEVDAKLAGWEEEQAGEQQDNSASSDGEVVTTRWTPSISLEQIVEGVIIDTNTIKWRPTSIRDTDTYSITFDIENDIEVLPTTKNISLVIIFTPSSRDTVIDIANTGMYSTKTPIIWWDSDFTPSDGVDCRRIEFVSDLFTISAPTTQISLDFDLYYAK